MVVFLLAPQATMMHGLTDLEHLEQTQTEHQHHTYYIYPGNTRLPFPRCWGLCHRYRRHRIWIDDGLRLLNKRLRTDNGSACIS